MPSAERLDLSALRAAAVDGDGSIVPLPSLVAGTLTWPWPHAHRVLHAWRDWAEETGGIVRTSVRLARPVRGQAVVAVDVALAGEPWGASGALSALRRLRPAIDSVRPVAPAAVWLRSPRAPAGTTPLRADLLLRELPPEAVDAFAAATADAELLSAALHRVGGGYAVSALGAARGLDEEERVRTGLAQLRRRLAPWT
jgi:hypothetical protein